jgi:outer membrane protein OmpA-like peptidoglycan-associated protein
MSSTEIKKPNSTENRGQKSFEKSNSQPNIMGAMISVTLILLLTLVGYIIYESKLTGSARWAMEDIASPQMNWFLEKETLKAETIKNAASQKDQALAKASPENEGLSAENSVISSKKDENHKAEVSPDLGNPTLPNGKIAVYFESNSNELSEPAYKSLDQLVQFISQYPNSEIIIEGYTDSTGNHAYNKKLSTYRAQIVKTCLIAKGVDSLKITAVGLGSQNFIASNKTEGGRRLNRRVEIKINIKHN